MNSTPAEHAAVSAHPCEAGHTWRVYDPDADSSYFLRPYRYRFARCPECKTVSSDPAPVRIARAKAMEEFAP